MNFNCQTSFPVWFRYEITHQMNQPSNRTVKWNYLWLSNTPHIMAVLLCCLFHTCTIPCPGISLHKNKPINSVHGQCACISAVAYYRKAIESSIYIHNINIYIYIYIEIHKLAIMKNPSVPCCLHCTNHQSARTL